MHACMLLHKSTQPPDGRSPPAEQVLACSLLQDMFRSAQCFKPQSRVNFGPDNLAHAADDLSAPFSVFVKKFKQDWDSCMRLQGGRC
jgi:hypothetical protein